MSGIRSNAVKGNVFFQREGAKFPLEAGMKLEQGDFIRSSKDAYAELLLQPGNYLRVGGDTEFQIFSDPHDKMRLTLNTGALNIEFLAREGANWWYQMDEATELMRVITPDAEVFISRPGIIRINTTPSGRTEVVVREGEAVINGYRVKKKRRAVAANGSATITEIDAKSEDTFDKWSHDRAVQLVKENKLLKDVAPWSKRLRKGETWLEVPDDDKNDNTSGRVISARPGIVIFAEDGVEFSRAAEGWQPLAEQWVLEAGDKIRTNRNSLVELMLFPDTNLRIGASSEILFDKLSNDEVSVKVVRGSAILDLPRFDRKKPPKITLGGSSMSVVVNDRGNYRIDGNIITVREGEVIFNERFVDGCKRIDSATISDCDKKPADNFDFWSQHRGEGELYNGRATVTMATHLAALRRKRFKTAGFWYQQPGKTSYVFVPFTSLMFRSPYGGNYTTALAPLGSTITRDDGGSKNPNRRGPEIFLPKTDIRRPNP
jgi:hypothetical protein